MRRAAPAAIAALAAALAPTVALAKAPKAPDTASVEELCELARKTIEDGKKAYKSPFKETIDKYRDKTKTPLADWKPVTDIINDAKTPEAQAYRDDAVQALVDRFADGDKDPQVRAIRRDAALAVYDLMKADLKKDPTGLSLMDRLINAWWRTQNNADFKYHAKDSPDARKKSWDRLKKYLKGDG